MINVKAILEDFETYQQALNLAKTTIEWNRHVLVWFFSFLEEQGIENLTDVNTKVILKYQIHLSQMISNQGKPYKSATLNNAISTVRKLFKYLRLKHEVFIDPTDGMEFAKREKALPRNILSVKEADKVLAVQSSWRDRAMLEVLYSTGIRQGELRNLELNDLQPDDGTIFIRHGKGGKDRVVPCGDTAWEAIEYYLEQERPLIAEADEQILFLNKYGNRFSKKGIIAIVKGACIKAGIDRNITPHSFRHAVATSMIDNGCDIRYVQELLGHASLNTTAIYTHVSVVKLKEAHQKFHPRESAGEQEEVA